MPIFINSGRFAAALSPIVSALTPQVWYDPSLASSVTLNGSNVAQINDLSGNNRHLTALTTKQPTYTTAGINGLNCLTYDGTSDSLRSTSASITQTQPMTWVAVVKFSDVSSQHGLWVNQAGTVAGITAGSGSWRMAAGGSYFKGTPDTSLHCIVGVINGASSLMRIDGVALATQDAGSNALSADELFLGRNIGGSVYMVGDVGECGLIPGNPSVTALEAYLKAKWGTP